MNKFQTLKISSHTIKSLGIRASEYAIVNAIHTKSRTALLIPSHTQTDAVERKLNEVFGYASTIDRGEVAYWLVDGKHLEKEMK